MSDRNIYGVLQETSGKRPPVRELNGVRGLAALIVFFTHAVARYPLAKGWGPGVQFTYSFFQGATAWVDIFFILSGFFITTLLLNRRTEPFYYRNFYIRRGARILPLYLLCLVAMLLAYPGSRGYVILCALFLANFAANLHYGGEGPFWTLAIEEQFYLLWPTFVRRLQITYIARSAVAIAIGCNLLRFAAAAVGHHNFTLTPFRCDGLAMGAFLVCHFRWHPYGDRRPEGERRAFLLAIALGLGCILPASLSHAIQQHIAMQEALFNTGVVATYVGALGLIIAHPGHPKLAFFRSRVLGFFGLISYAFYMTHMFVIWGYDRLRGDLLPGDVAGFLLRILLVFLGTIAVSLLTRYLVELPALSLRKRLLPTPVPRAETELPLAKA